MKSSSNQLRGLLSLFALLVFPLVMNQPVEAAMRASFEYTCETTEDDFYDWIEAELWPKPTASTGAINFGRNLDAAFDILTDRTLRRSDWEIILTTVDCQSDLATELRRESIFETIEDAHADGHGRVLRSP